MIRAVPARSAPSTPATAEAATAAAPVVVTASAASAAPKSAYPPPAEQPTQEGPKGVRYDFNLGARILLPQRQEGEWRVKLSDMDTGNTLFESKNKGAMVASAKRLIRSLARDDAMMISCEVYFQKIRTPGYAGFGKSSSTVVRGGNEV